MLESVLNQFVHTSCWSDKTHLLSCCCSCCSVAKLCLTLCDPVVCSRPGIPAHHQLLKLAQVHDSWVSDAIQPSLPLSCPSPFAFRLCHALLHLPSVFPSVSVFSSGLALHIRGPKDWNFGFSISPFYECSGLISFRIYWFDLLADPGTLKSLL